MCPNSPDTEPYFCAGRSMVAEGRGVDTRLQIVGAMFLIGGWRGWSEPDWTQHPHNQRHTFT